MRILFVGKGKLSEVLKQIREQIKNQEEVKGK